METEIINRGYLSNRQEKSYWAGNGEYQFLVNQLDELVPARGEVEHPYVNQKLERFRKATSAYYDLFNNGGCNRDTRVAYYFPGAISRARYRSWNLCLAITEPIMHKIILLAAIEQGMFSKAVYKELYRPIG